MPNKRGLKINEGGEGGGGGSEILVKFNKRGVKINGPGGIGISKNPLISVMNEKRRISV